MLHDRVARSDRGDGRGGPSDHGSASGQSLAEFALVLPILLLLLVGVGDLARLYTTMIAVESAAREAADFGAYGSSNWLGDPSDPTSNEAATRAAMEERACMATRHLVDHQGSGSTCTNPTVTITLLEPGGAVASESSGCELADRPGGPCRVQVDLDHTFDLIMPIGLDVNGQRFGFPESLAFRRTSLFANSDFILAPW